MEKRIFGVILTILGIAGLILAAYNFVQGNTTTNHSITVSDRMVFWVWFSFLPVSA